MFGSSIKNLKRCPFCDKSFMTGSAKAIWARHLQICKSSRVITTEVPVLPEHLIEPYHGSWDDFDGRGIDMDSDDSKEFADIQDFALMGKLFGDAPPGLQERPFNEVLLYMDADLEARYFSLQNLF